jgi:hypothetical protein
MAATESEVKSGEMAVHPAIYMGSRSHLPWMQRIEEHASWQVLARVPETMTALIALPHFTVRELLTMEVGRVYVSGSLTSELIPIKIGSVQLAWAEFEVVDAALALRVTKLA